MLSERLKRALQLMIEDCQRMRPDYWQELIRLGPKAMLDGIKLNAIKKQDQLMLQVCAEIDENRQEVEQLIAAAMGMT